MKTQTRTDPKNATARPPAEGIGETEHTKPKISNSFESEDEISIGRAKGEKRKPKSAATEEAEMKHPTPGHPFSSEDEAAADAAQGNLDRKKRRRQHRA